MMTQVLDDRRSWIHIIAGALSYFFQSYSSFSLFTSLSSGNSRKIKSLEMLLSFSQVVEVLPHAKA